MEIKFKKSVNTLLALECQQLIIALVYKTTLESRFFCILQNVILQFHLERQLKNMKGIFLYIKRTLIEFMMDNEFKNLNRKPGYTY